MQKKMLKQGESGIWNVWDIRWNMKLSPLLVPTSFPHFAFFFSFLGKLESNWLCSGRISALLMLVPNPHRNSVAASVAWCLACGEFFTSRDELALLSLYVSCGSSESSTQQWLYRLQPKILIFCSFSRSSIPFLISLGCMKASFFLLHSVSFLHCSLAEALFPSYFWWPQLPNILLYTAVSSVFPRQWVCRSQKDKMVWTQHLLKWAQALLMTLVWKSLPSKTVSWYTLRRREVSSHPPTLPT